MGTNLGTHSHREGFSDGQVGERNELKKELEGHWTSPSLGQSQKGGADATVNSHTHCLTLVDRFRGVVSDASSEVPGKRCSPRCSLAT
jgi:hypothetical protein